MKKSLIFLVVSAALGILLAYERPYPTTKVVSQQNTNQTQTTENTTPNIVTPKTDTPQVTDTKTGLKNGTFEGALKSNRYETVKVTISVTAGKIVAVDVPVIDYTEGGRSIQIVQTALPFLKQSAIEKQSSDIDYVSGATLISMSFADSLETAIQKAKS